MNTPEVVVNEQHVMVNKQQEETGRRQQSKLEGSDEGADTVIVLRSFDLFEYEDADRPGLLFSSNGEGRPGICRINKPSNSVMRYLQTRVGQPQLWDKR